MQVEPRQLRAALEQPREKRRVLVRHPLAAQVERRVGGELLDRHEPQVHLEQQDGRGRSHGDREHGGRVLG